MKIESFSKDVEGRRDLDFVLFPGGTILAEFKWLAGKDVPVFTFYGKPEEVAYRHKRQMEQLEHDF